jgi:thymidylate kinase
MIIWINGAFGAGKTTLAEELHRRLPDALAFDPEFVGYILSILHVFLDVLPEELHRRIDAQVLHEDNPEADASAGTFRHRNVERCVAAGAELPGSTLILRGDRHTPAELADLVMDALR